MQSGKRNEERWVLEFYPEARRSQYAVMGWTSSTDMKQELLLEFDCKEAAMLYAEKAGWEYEVREPQRKKLHIRPYADNFK